MLKNKNRVMECATQNKKRRSETLAPDDLVYVIYAVDYRDPYQKKLFDVTVVEDMKKDMGHGEFTGKKTPYVVIDGYPTTQIFSLQCVPVLVEDLTETQKQMLDEKKFPFHYVRL